HDEANNRVRQHSSCTLYLFGIATRGDKSDASPDDNKNCNDACKKEERVGNVEKNSRKTVDVRNILTIAWPNLTHISSLTKNQKNAREKGREPERRLKNFWNLEIC